MLSLAIIFEFLDVTLEKQDRAGDGGWSVRQKMQVLFWFAIYGVTLCKSVSYSNIQPRRPSISISCPCPWSEATQVLSVGRREVW